MRRLYEELKIAKGKVGRIRVLNPNDVVINLLNVLVLIIEFGILFKVPLIQYKISTPQSFQFLTTHKIFILTYL